MKLNGTQKGVLVIYSVVLLCICAYVPWSHSSYGAFQYRIEKTLGYAPIWLPPEDGRGVKVDLQRLGIEAFAASVIAVIGLAIGANGTPRNYGKRLSSALRGKSWGSLWLMFAYVSLFVGFIVTFIFVTFILIAGFIGAI
jgi:hypothetical protein